MLISLETEMKRQLESMQALLHEKLKQQQEEAVNEKNKLTVSHKTFNL